MTIDEFKEKIAPHMKKGWVAMDRNGDWYFFPSHPILNEVEGVWEYEGNEDCTLLSPTFKLPRVSYKKSLMEVGK